MRWGEPVLCSSITEITTEGPVYRNRPAMELALSGVSFESVAQFLVTGVWQDRIGIWPALSLPDDVMLLVDAYAGHLAAADVGALFGMLAFALGMQGRGATEVADGGTTRGARQLIQAMVGCMGFLGPQRRFVTPNEDESIAAFLLRAAGGGQSQPDSMRIMNSALVLLADHELAPATFAARIAASTDADLFNCVATAIGSQEGSSTGTSTRNIETLLLPRVVTTDQERRLDLVREYGASLFGFNYPLYPAGDPRARLLLELISGLGSPSDETASLLEFLELARSGLEAYPGVAIALVALTRALGLPDGAAIAIWIISRTAGWAAHVLEQRTQAFLLRPRAKHIEVARM
ncbi:citrate synthase [Paraburkholderia xenovorans]